MNVHDDEAYLNIGPLFSAGGYRGPQAAYPRCLAENFRLYFEP